MGNQNQNIETEGLKRSKKCKETNKMLQFLTCATILSLSVGAPQYGGVQPSPPVKTAPLTGSVQCRTETQRLCQPTTRQECNTVYEKECQTVYKAVCVEQFKTEYEPYTETECSTEYKEDCEYQWEGHGHDKVWAPIAGTCKKNPYESCKDVAKSKAVQVGYPVCHDVPEQKCVSVPRQNCQTQHKKVPIRVSRQVPKKVCDTAHTTLDNLLPSSGPEIVDARLETEDRESPLLFQRNQVDESPSDNAIV